MAHSNATQVERSDNSYLHNDLNNKQMTTTLNTAKEPPCAKYLRSTSSSRPASHGILGSQRLGKKTILHTDHAHYEMYMQLQQLQRKPDVKVYGEDSPCEPWSRNKAIVAVASSGKAVKKRGTAEMQQANATSRSPKSRGPTVDARKNSCLFEQVSQQMQAAFTQK